MAIQISRREVMNNLIRFKDALLEQNQGKEDSTGRTYPVLVNRKTGDIRFAERVSQLEHRLPKPGKPATSLADWREVRIHVSTENPKIVHFELLDERETELKSDGMEILAWNILNETIQVLNQIAESHPPSSPEVLPEEAVLQDLSEIHLASPSVSIQAMPGWHGPIDRYEAERLLRDEPAGTYLLREGDSLTKEITELLGEKIYPYLCTIIESEQRISDILLLQTPKGWTLYEDCFDLTETTYYT
ncbi:MAG: hypothetical protein KGJ02_03265, partial [Verrucomicrobiota bacterium]|nr:hypothetical protein [Verrucomicrobiota bacterium]